MKHALLVCITASTLLMSPLTQAQQESYPFGEKNSIVVSISHRIWQAYDAQGELVKEGRVSAGRNYCPDLHRACRTPVGTYTIYAKKGPECISSKFPLGEGGAPMPYCMYFKGGYAIHGSYEVPNYNASHGCIRVIPSDARWLNQTFVKTGVTRIVIRP